MYERFTDRARRVMQLANQEAQRLNPTLACEKESAMTPNKLDERIVELQRENAALRWSLPMTRPLTTQEFLATFDKYSTTDRDEAVELRDALRCDEEIAVCGPLLGGYCLVLKRAAVTMAEIDPSYTYV